MPCAGRAHTLGLSTGDFVLYPGGRVEASLVFAGAEALGGGGGGGRDGPVSLDRNHDGLVSNEELAAAEPDLRALIARGVEVRADSEVCPGRFEGAALNATDGLEIDATFACSSVPQRLVVTLYFLSDLGAAHREVARLTAGNATEQRLLSATAREIALDVPSEMRPLPRSGRGVYFLLLLVAVGALAGTIWWRRYRERARSGG